MTPDVIKTINAVFEFLLTALFLGFAIWALRAYINHRTKLPRAKEGFLNLDDLKAHCGSVQKQCLENLTQKMEMLANVIDRRLEQGDKLFEAHTEQLRPVEKELTQTATKLKDFEKGFCDRVVSVITKLQKGE